MAPVSFCFQILQVVIVDAAYMLDLLDIGDSQSGQVFLFFGVIGQEA